MILKKEEYNKDWDAAVNAALDGGHVFTDLKDNTGTLNGTTLWISRYPDHYGYPYRNQKGVKVPDEIQEQMHLSKATKERLRQLELKQKGMDVNSLCTQMIMGPPK